LAAQGCHATVHGSLRPHEKRQRGEKLSHVDPQREICRRDVTCPGSAQSGSPLLVEQEIVQSQLPMGDVGILQETEQLPEGGKVVVT